MLMCGNGFGLFTMEVILATAFSRDVSLDGGKDNPLIRAAASIFQTGGRQEII